MYLPVREIVGIGDLGDASLVDPEVAVADAAEVVPSDIGLLSAARASSTRELLGAAEVEVAVEAASSKRNCTQGVLFYFMLGLFEHTREKKRNSHSVKNRGVM